VVDVAAFVADVEVALTLSATAERAEYEKRYLKSELRFIGAAMPAVRTECARQYKLLKPVSRIQLDLLTDALWNSKCHELRSVAICLMVRASELFGLKDLPRIRSMISESAGWAHVDWLSTDLVGSIYSADLGIEDSLRKWAKDGDFWVRRASMLALLREATKGNRAAFDLFSELAAQMTPEKEFFIRKAIGWILREVSKKNPDWTFEFLKQNSSVARLTYREAIKYLPDELIAKLS
jgi:3-methyladenine DNA glycosylase AlkD